MYIDFSYFHNWFRGSPINKTEAKTVSVPAEIWVEIFDNLEFRDISSLSLVCRQWSELVKKSRIYQSRMIIGDIFNELTNFNHTSISEERLIVIALTFEEKIKFSSTDVTDYFQNVNPSLNRTSPKEEMESAISDFYSMDFVSTIREPDWENADVLFGVFFKEKTMIDYFFSPRSCRCTKPYCGIHLYYLNDLLSQKQKELAMRVQLSLNQLKLRSYDQEYCVEWVPHLLWGSI